MGLEIEFDYDDTQDGVWSPAHEAPPLRERVGRRWNLGLAAGNPLFVHLGIALAALALGAASTAGFVEGGNAARDRATTRLHLAPVGPFVVEPLDVPSTQSPEVLLHTPWTDTFDRHVSLSVINDGPEPVSVLGARVTAPQFGAADLHPATGGRAAPGGVVTLRGMAHIVCGDFTSVDLAATVARLTVLTADGRTRVETLMVDRFSDIQEQAVCRAMHGPQVVTSVSTVLSKTPGRYTFIADVTNRAPYPLLVTMPSTIQQSWDGIAGLSVQAPAPATIPPHGSAVVTIPVAVNSCQMALVATQSAYAYTALAFTDARDGTNNPLARESDQDLALTDVNAIEQYCGALELPGISGGGSAK